MKSPAIAFAALAALAASSSATPVDPCELRFNRLASRRFVLDNDLTLSEYLPDKVVASVQHPPAAFDPSLAWVGAWYPCTHCSADVAAVAPGASVKIAAASPDGAVRAVFAAKPGEPIEGSGSRFAVPAPPFRFSVLMTGGGAEFCITKDGRTRYHGRRPYGGGTGDWREKSRAGTCKVYAGGQGVKLTRAAVALTAGYGQADVRFVTTGRDKRLYFENGRVFFTFSARGAGAMGVASFDPTLFDVRLEGAILFDAGDGLLRSDGPADLYYDEPSGEWRAWVCNFSTVVSTNGFLTGRAKGGVNVARSVRSPLHGLSVMRERSLGLDGMNEDPTAFYDAAAGMWRMFLSEFTGGGIRGSLWEASAWDGPYRRLTPPTKEDSTGQCLAAVGGRRWALAGSADRACHVYEYPSLRLHGDLKFDFPPWNDECPNGRVWATLAELPDGFPFKYIFLTMDRACFPDIPRPNWTYGALHYYAAKERKE